MSSDVMMGTSMDVQDHPANTVPEATQHYAGDVLPMPGELSMGKGVDSRAAGYALGKTTSDKVAPMPIEITKGWLKRQREK